MPQEPSTPVAETNDLDYRLLIPFLAHTTLIQTLILIIRITTSYRAIELGLPVVWLGIIATGFAILPVFTALQVGRWIDRGNDAKACWIGTALILLACVGFWLWSRSAMHLLAFSILLGFGHMFCMAGHQMLAVRSNSPRSRERRARLLHDRRRRSDRGSGRSWSDGSAARPRCRRPDMLFAIALGAAVASVIVALLIRPARKQTRHERSAAISFRSARSSGCADCRPCSRPAW